MAEGIRNSIFSGELSPGAPLGEVHLAELHQVSQTTVREALVRLEHAGLVRRIHNVGTFVTQMSPREIQERLRLRVMLEGLAGMEAARFISSRQLAEIDERMEAMARAIGAVDYFAAGQADLEFHRTVWQCSGDSVLYQVLDQITVPLFAFVSLERQRRHERINTELVREHEPIVKALRERDPGAAQEAMRRHLENSYHEFRGTVQGYALAVS